MTGVLIRDYDDTNTHKKEDHVKVVVCKLRREASEEIVGIQNKLPQDVQIVLR